MHYDAIVFIGRFQPFHRAHREIVARALEKAERVVLLLGSAEAPRTVANPWTVSERAQMIRAAFPEDSARLLFCGLVDCPYDNQAWQQNAVASVRKILPEAQKIALIGHQKDASSFYLALFPEWTFIGVENIDALNATDIRRFYFEMPAAAHFFHEDLPESVNMALAQFRHSAQYARLQCEWWALRRWQGAHPLPENGIFVRAEAAVFCGEKILLQPREEEVGSGLWQLPGAFLSTEDAESVARRCAPKTAKLQGAAKIFDHPSRNPYGRVLSLVFPFSSPDLQGPGTWLPRTQIARAECFSDLYSIIEAFS